MSTSSPNLARRERAIEDARRRLRQLEIETHRIKADLARLEADYEDDVADVLTHRLRRRGCSNPSLSDDDAEAASSSTTIFASVVSAETTGLNVHSSDVAKSANVPRRRFGQSPLSAPSPIAQRDRNERPPSIHGTVETPKSFPVVSASRRTLWPNRKTAGPLVCSFAVHAIALLFCLSLTFVTLVQQQIPLFANPVPAEDEIPAPLDEVKIEPTKFNDADLQNTLAIDDDFNVADQVSAELEPAEVGAGVKTLGDIGQLDALPSDLATLMAGAGKPSSGKPGGDIGNAVFFGARSKGNRFVFVIDNSSSMQSGRLDAARAELLRTIGDLSPKQSFYVIFIADQTYPMFFPRPELDMLPATATNIKHLTAWLPNAILASGKNRELIKAMDMAAALRPDAVYLLWDGDLKYSESVRRDVMTHLTAPNQWNFLVHTVGFNITSLDSEQNLTTIAQAHGGVYRRIDLPTVRSK